MKPGIKKTGRCNRRPENDCKDFFGVSANLVKAKRFLLKGSDIF